MFVDHGNASHKIMGIGRVAKPYVKSSRFTCENGNTKLSE